MATLMQPYVPCCPTPPRKDGRDVGLIPVAIELAHRGNIAGSAGEVYSRAALMADKKQQVLWGLAKAAFK